MPSSRRPPKPAKVPDDASALMREGEDFWRLRGMGFSEAEADEALALRIPMHKIISLVEIRKCPPHLALEILRD